MDFTDYRYYLWLLISFTIFGVLLFFSLKKKWSFKTCTYIMAGVAIVSECIKMFTHVFAFGYFKSHYFGDDSIGKYDYSNGGQLLAKSLPLHLCSILIFVVFYLAWGKNEKVKEVLKSFLAPIGIFGGFLAIILATSGVKFWDEDIHYAFDTYQTFTYHSVLLWYAMYLAITEQAKLHTKDFFRNCGLMFALGVSMIWINSALQIYDTNFCFVVAPPANNLPFLNLKYGWFVYFIHLCLGTFFLEFLIHLRWIIQDIKVKRNAPKEVETDA